MIDGVTMEIKSPNWQEMHWIREMLRQGMVFARQTTATWSRGSMISYILLFGTVRVPVFYLSKNRTENRFLVPVRVVNRVLVHKTNT